MDIQLRAGKLLGYGVISFFVLRLLGRWARKRFIIPKFTVFEDLPNVGKARKGEKFSGQAVVCGGSVAGILAAAALSDHYEKVLIVEPEAWVATEEGTKLPVKRDIRQNEDGYPILHNNRSRVLQSNSFHGYLPVLVPILRQLFPNFEDEIDKMGLSSNVGGCDIKLHMSGIPAPPRPPEQEMPTTFYFTRDTFEVLIRKCLLTSRDNVQQIVGTVTGVSRSPDNPLLLDSVTIRPPNGPQITEKAAIIVDATGPSHAGLKWLNRLGLTLPPSMRHEYATQMHYASMTFVIPPYLQERLPIPGGWENNNFIYFFVPNPEVERNAIILAIFEYSQLGLWCGAREMDKAPCTIGDFKTLAAELHSSQPVPQYFFDICDMLEEHIDEINPASVITKLPPSSYIHYHKFAKMPDFPSNFVALGDAAMVVNPFYGQGLGKAAIGAVTLDHVLRRSNPTEDPRFSQTFFKKQSDRIDGIWPMNKDGDYAFASTTPVKGETHEVGRFSRWFGKQLMTLAFTDPKLFWMVWDSRWMLLPPTDVMNPVIVTRVLWAWLTSR